MSVLGGENSTRNRIASEDRIHEVTVRHEHIWDYIWEWHHPKPLRDREWCATAKAQGASSSLGATGFPSLITPHTLDSGSCVDTVVLSCPQTLNMWGWDCFPGILDAVRGHTPAVPQRCGGNPKEDGEWAGGRYISSFSQRAPPTTTDWELTTVSHY